MERNSYSSAECDVVSDRAFVRFLHTVLIGGEDSYQEYPTLAVNDLDVNDLLNGPVFE